MPDNSDFNQNDHELYDDIVKLILSSSIPEAQKLKFRILLSGQNLSEDIMNMCVSVLLDDNTSPDSFENQEKVYEYLGLMKVGLEQFCESENIQFDDNSES